MINHSVFKAGPKFGPNFSPSLPKNEDACKKIAEKTRYLAFESKSFCKLMKKITLVADFIQKLRWELKGNMGDSYSPPALSKKWFSVDSSQGAGLFHKYLLGSSKLILDLNLNK